MAIKIFNKFLSYHKKFKLIRKPVNNKNAIDSSLRENKKERTRILGIYFHIIFQEHFISMQLYFIFFYYNMNDQFL